MKTVVVYWNLYWQDDVRDTTFEKVTGCLVKDGILVIHQEYGRKNTYIPAQQVQMWTEEDA
jgi:hypothetical protein